MQCEHFETLAAGLLRDAGDDRIRAVRTFAEAGFVKPLGVEIADTSGYRIVVQFVRTSPPGGDRVPYEPRADLRSPIRRTPQPLPADARVKGARPALGVLDVEALLKRVIVDADHAEVASVHTYAEADLTTKPAGVRVTFTDGSVVYCMFVGVIPPGAERIPHAEFEIPKEMLCEVSAPSAAR